MSNTWNSLPIVRCPHCGEEWQWDDYYDSRVGSGRECPHCNTEIVVTEMDTVIYFRLEVKQPAQRN